MNLLKLITEHRLTKLFVQGNFGLEKENLRATEEGDLALTDHPIIFGDKQKNPYITTDFSESQIEMITPVRPSVESAHQCLENIHSCVLERLEGELLWPQSIPCRVPSEALIPIAKFSDTPSGNAARVYREKLAENGKAKQLISGIHFNFSFTDAFVERVYAASASNASLKEFKSELYMSLSRGFLKYRFAIIYLFGASFAMDKSFGYNKCGLAEYDQETLFFKNATSFRNGRCGYNNKEKFVVHYTSLENYIEDIDRAIMEGKIQGLSEFYSPIRLKTKNSKPTIDDLRANGVEYVEVRTIDLNPLDPIGLDLRDMQFLHLFLLFCTTRTVKATTESLAEWGVNHNLVAEQGRDLETLLAVNGEATSLKNLLVNFFDEFKLFLVELDLFSKYQTIYEFQLDKVIKSETSYVAQLEKMVKESGYISAHLELAKGFKKKTVDNAFNMTGYEDLELSTQILLKSAIVKGAKFHFLDRGENFITLEQEGKLEYVKQATKTSKDSYITALIMENKTVTKKIVHSVGVRVPAGEEYSSVELAYEDRALYDGKSIVIKPKSTNFGIGISILQEGHSENAYLEALTIAFGHDIAVLVEEFIPGEEYRFLIIDGVVEGVLNRRAANVLGDGVHTITELVALKNLDPLRGEGYVKPLEKIQIGEIERALLKVQGYTEFDILPNGITAFLRKNSNISTGGDSVDVTDRVAPTFKELALVAAKSVNARICGVDMLIDTIEDEKSAYAVIELNFNPAIHIHCFPYLGTKRAIGDKIIDLLFKNE